VGIIGFRDREERFVRGNVMQRVFPGALTVIRKSESARVAPKGGLRYELQLADEEVA